MKPQKPLKPYGIRLDPDKRALAAIRGIDLGDLFRRALDQELAKESAVCPTCGVRGCK